jgi:fatty acid desaturase
VDVEPQQVGAVRRDGYGSFVSDSTGPGRRVALAQRYWWANLVIGIGFLVIAARWAVDRDKGWPVLVAVWTILGLWQVVIGIIKRREGPRR